MLVAHKVCWFPLFIKHHLHISIHSNMKLATILSFVTAVTALPAVKNDVAARASYSKADGLKFNIDGVTKCKLLIICLKSCTDILQTTQALTATGSLSSPMTTMSTSSWAISLLLSRRSFVYGASMM